MQCNRPLKQVEAEGESDVPESELSSLCALLMCPLTLASAPR
jgi:hypothetical protein